MLMSLFCFCVGEFRFTRLPALSGSGLHCYLLALEVQNVQGNATFILQQISTLAPGWQLLPLSYETGCTDHGILRSAPRRHKCAHTPTHIITLVHSTLSFVLSAVHGKAPQTIFCCCNGCYDMLFLTRF